MNTSVQLPAAVMTDIDGVWTDGGMYYDREGNEQKKFNTSDSAGILFLRALDIPVAIITGETTPMVTNRAAKLKIEHVRQGISDKVGEANDLCRILDISLDQVAYIGDDLNDMKLLREVGISGCPANGSDYVKGIVDIVTKKSGGDGAFREFVESILIAAGRFDEVLEKVVGVERSNWQ